MKNTLFYTRPAASHFEAMVLGNGHIGALVFGDPREERISLNDDRLWSGDGKEHLNPEAIRYLDTAKTLVQQGKLREAQDMVEQHMVGRWSEAYVPLGDLRLFFDGEDTVEDYRLELHLADGVCTVFYRRGGAAVTARRFTSFPDDVLVYELQADTPLSFTLTYESQLEHTLSTDGNRLILCGRAPDHIAPDYDKVCPRPIVMGEGTGMGFCGAVQVLCDGIVTAKETGLRVENATRCTLLHTSCTAVSDTEYRNHCLTVLQQAAQKTEQLLPRHIADFRPLFDRVDIELGESHDHLPTDERIRAYRENQQDMGLIALLFAFGRYLMISCQRQGLPGNAQGMWNWDLRPAWSSNYTTNINIQLNYWATDKANVGECGEPYADWMLSLLPRGKRVARAHYGARGFCMHHNVDGWGMCTPSGGIARYMFWPVAGVWLCEQVFDHYLYGGDRRYLREKALPLLEESVLFCLDWLHKNADGYYVSGLSTSPENTFYIDDSGKEISVCQMTASDILLIDKLFENYLRTVEILDSDPYLVAEVREKREHLLPLGIDANGFLMEWDKPYAEHDPGHRHITPLMGIFPGTKELEDPALCRAARKLFDRRLAAGGGMLGWSASVVASTAARFHDGAVAHKYVSSLVERCISPNLFDIYIRANELPETRGDGNYTFDDCGVENCCFQIDGNFGGTVAVSEMLLQDCLGYIELLPALPAPWHTGHLTGMKAKRDITVDQSFRDGELLSFRLTAGAGFGEVDTLRVRYKESELTATVHPGDTLSGHLQNGILVWD